MINLTNVRRLCPFDCGKMFRVMMWSILTLFFRWRSNPIESVDGRNCSCTYLLLIFREKYFIELWTLKLSWMKLFNMICKWSIIFYFIAQLYEKKICDTSSGRSLDPSPYQRLLSSKQWIHFNKLTILEIPMVLYLFGNLINNFLNTLSTSSS